MLGGNDVCCARGSQVPQMQLVCHCLGAISCADPLQGRGTDICADLELQCSGRRTSGWSHVLAEIQAQHDIHTTCDLTRLLCQHEVRKVNGPSKQQPLLC
jgi:hypothetical protein